MSKITINKKVKNNSHKTKERLKKTWSQQEKQNEWESRTGWVVKRRSLSSEGILNLVCVLGELTVDVRIGRRGGETPVLRDPDSLTASRVIASLITARSQEVRDG